MRAPFSIFDRYLFALQYPVEFLIGSAKIPAHLVFEMLAYTLGYRLYVRQRARSQDLISDENRWWIFIGAAAGALLGSHLLGILENPQNLAHLNLLLWMGNKTIVGGLLGGLAGVEITKKIISVSASSGDLMTYPLIAGLAMGRLGCHFAGLTDGTHGLPSSLPWAVDFGDGAPRHPVNLYEIVFLVALAGFIYWLESGKGPRLSKFLKLGKSAANPPAFHLADGARFKIFLIGYLIWRFFVEWLKPVYVFPFGLSTIQLACMAGLFYYRKHLFHPFKLFQPDNQQPITDNQ
ncbi:MAG TPA: prolipoprotein diacylglyceryl transferase [Saprospiraceae bacterium]|nr:prolipoprotein diacylglyceryl transferase [Saprospiraceae bacterium]